MPLTDDELGLLAGEVRDFVDEKLTELRAELRGPPATQAQKAKALVSFADLERVLDAVTKRFSGLRAEFESKIAGLPHDAGVHERGKQYKRGALVTHAGSVFIAQVDTSAEIGGTPPSPDWRLFCQRGKSSR